MRADNVFFMTDNWLQPDLVALSASSAVTPISRLFERRSSRVWATAGASHEWLAGAFAAPQVITHVVIYNHNMDANGLVRLRLGDDADMVAVKADVTAEALECDAGLGFDGFGRSLGGYPDAAERSEYAPYIVLALPAPVSVGHIRLDFYNPGLAAGRLQIGAVLAGVGYQPRRNADRGVVFRWVDPSEQVITGGGVFVVGQASRRRLKITLSRLAEDEAISIFERFLRRHGRKRPFFVEVFPRRSGPLRRKFGIYGVMAADVEGVVGYARTPLSPIDVIEV